MNPLNPLELLTPAPLPVNYSIRYVLRAVQTPIPMIVPKPLYVVAVDGFGVPTGHTHDIRRAGVYTRVQLVESCIGDMVRDGTHEALRWDSAEKLNTEVLNAWEGYSAI